jgi:hypothetical protein
MRMLRNCRERPAKLGHCGETRVRSADNGRSLARQIFDADEDDGRRDDGLEEAARVADDIQHRERERHRVSKREDRDDDQRCGDGELAMRIGDRTLASLPSSLARCRRPAVMSASAILPAAAMDTLARL